MSFSLRVFERLEKSMHRRTSRGIHESTKPESVFSSLAKLVDELKESALLYALRNKQAALLENIITIID